MTISAVNSNEQRPHKIASAAAVGGVVGAAGRYVVPTQKELSGLFNKENMDTFVSSAATVARGQSRSMLKSAGIGAAIVASISAIATAFKSAKKIEASDTFEYSKMGMLLDAPDYVYEIYCYGD